MTTALFTLCSRLVFRRQGYALVAALVLVMGALFARDVSPVNRLLILLATTSDSAELLAPTGGMLAIAVAVLVVFAAVTGFVAARRE